mmetsp:Transcript_32443/g.52544  ORF Transcript_32443/g.52544 Transcript_32443/m.52544 type:complete len:98 (+) Transcript_32443:272-565(+)
MAHQKCSQACTFHKFPCTGHEPQKTSQSVFFIVLKQGGNTKRTKARRNSSLVLPPGNTSKSFFFKKHFNLKNTTIDHRLKSKSQSDMIIAGMFVSTY